MDLDILNPEFNGVRFRVQISETTEPTEWQAENLERAAKKAGKDGDYITHNGDYIFSNSDVVLLPEGTDPTHSFLTPDTERLAVKANTAVKQDEVENLM